LGGRLSDFFYLDANGPHQLIGPSNQFAIGLSDPSEWRPGLGDNADPTVISGAFSEDPALWTFQLSGNNPAIAFTGPDGVRKKTYSLSEDGLNVVYESFGAVSVTIPLALDPQTYYFSPAEYSLFSIPGGVAWGFTDGLRVGIHTQAALAARTFTDSQSLLHGPENPDLAYPAGHYLPFPLSVLNIQSISNFNIRINVIK
jgi:hypothetical protein